MATHARQQYFADENSLSKERREFSIADEIQEKIDSVEEGAQVNRIETVKVNGTALVPDANKAVNVEVPDVIDNLYTVAADDALSAKQGKILYDYIQNLQTIGRFLSNWDTATGLPITNPSESPYQYKAGDYYRVSNVAVSPASNYKPDGSSYTIGVASTTVETLSVAVSDLYLYDGTDWILLSNSGSGIAVDSSLSTTSTNPVENRVITNALNGKHPGEISNVAPSNPVEGMLWYDTVNDELKTYDGTAWTTEGTKMVVLEYGVSTWQDFIDAYNENAIVYCKVSSGSSGYRMAFMAYTAGQGTPTEVEFQYYRSRSSHSTSSTQLDEVYVYKLTDAGVWTTTQRDTGAEMIAGTGIGITFNSSGATINNTGVTSVNGNTGAVTVTVPTNTSDLTNDSGFITSADIPTNVSDFTNDAGYLTSSTGVTSFNGSTGAITYTAPVTSVNGNTGAVTVEEVPSGGTEGQVLTQTNNGPAWQNPIIGAEIEYKTQAEYNALPSSKLTDGKHYVIYTPDSPTPPTPWQPGVNTLVYYKIDDSDTNSTIYDHSGNSVDQTWSGTPSYTTDATYGRVASFDGSYYASAGSRVDFGNEVTFIALCNFDTKINNQNRALISQGQSSSTWATGIGEGIFGNGMYATFCDGGTPNDVGSGINPTEGIWYMIAGTRASDGTGKIYINGELKNTVTGLTTPTYNFGTNLRIGNRGNDTNKFHGLFKLFIGEDRCWTDAEIAALAQEYGFNPS